MVLSVKIFSLLREQFGADSLDIQVDNGSRVGEIVDRLCEQYPELKKYMSFARIAVNCTYVDTDEVVSDGDEVAILLPVSGG